MDLVEVEGLADLLQAETELQLKNVRILRKLLFLTLFHENSDL